VLESAGYTVKKERDVAPIDVEDRPGKERVAGSSPVFRSDRPLDHALHVGPPALADAYRGDAVPIAADLLEDRAQRLSQAVGVIVGS